MLACIHTTLRFLSLMTTLIAFICHITQCILLNVYQKKTGIPDWLSSGHWQYLLWFISLSLSLVGSSTLCLSAYCFNRPPKKYSMDKWVGSLSVLPVLVSVIIAMSTSEPFSFEPWTNGLIKVPRSRTLVSSCSLFDESRDKLYPLLYQRCLLSDFTWIFAILLCIIWCLLVGFAIFAALLLQQRRKNSIQPASAAERSATTTNKPQEPNWGRYIPDKPPAVSIYSVTTRRSSIGLLTPTSVKYGSQYYFGDYESVMPSLPSITRDYYYPTTTTTTKEKGGSYYEDSYSYNIKPPTSPPPSSHYYYNSNGRRNTYNKRDYYRSPSSSSSYNNYSSPPTTPSSYNYYNGNSPTTEYSSYDYLEKQHLMRPSTTSFSSRDSSSLLLLATSSSKSSSSTKKNDKEDGVSAAIPPPTEISTPLYLKFASKKSNNYFSLR